jgi:hypothetical protein
MDRDRATKPSAAIPKSLIAVRSGSGIEFQFSYYNTKTILLILRTVESFDSKLFIAFVRANVYRLTFNGKIGVSERSSAKTPVN